MQKKHRRAGVFCTMIILILFSATCSYVYAQAAGEAARTGAAGGEEYSQNFLSKSDPSEWDFSKVDYNLVPEDKWDSLLSDYGDKLDYSKIPYELLSESCYSRLDYKKVDVSKLDPDKVDYGKLAFDMGYSRDSINIGNVKSELRLSKDNEEISISHPNGDKVTLSTNYYPSETKFIIGENGVQGVFDRTYFKKNEIKLSPKDSLKLKMVMDFTNTNPITLSGTGASIVDGGIMVKDGKITSITEGGKAKLDGVLIDASKGAVNIYTEPNFEIKQHKNENFFYSNKDAGKIMLGSSKESSVDVKFSKENTLFQMSDVDRLNIGITGGDALEISQRKSKGPQGKDLVPMIKHYSSDRGSTGLENGRITFSIKNGKINLDSVEKFKTHLEGSERTSGSVALEFQSDSTGSGDKTIRVNAYNHFAIISGKEMRESVVYNKFNLPVSNLAEKNSILTLNQLREKYKFKNIDFTTEYINPFSTAKPKVYPNDASVHKELINLVDSWLENNPDAKIKTFILIQDNNAYGEINHMGEFNMILGAPILDPYSINSRLDSKDRNMQNPLNSMDHEYDHIQTAELANNERKIAENIKNSGKINEDYKNKIIKDYAENAPITSESLKYLLPKYLKKNNILIDDPAKKKEIDDFIILINNVGFDLAIKKYPAVKDIIVKSRLSDPVFNSRAEASLVQIDPETKSIYSFYDDICNDAKKRLSENKKFSDAVNILRQTFQEKNPTKYNLYSAPSNNKADKISRDIGFLYEIGDLNDKELEPLYNHALKIFEDTAGLPSFYSLRSYSKGIDQPAGSPMLGVIPPTGFVSPTNLPTVFTEDYEDLPTTFVEESLEERKIKMTSGSDMQKAVYIKLTQIQFDSGKMSAKDYKFLMGNNVCKQEDCCDQKCKIYKLACTRCS